MSTQTPWFWQQRQYPVDADEALGAQRAFGRAGYPAQISPGSAPGICIIVVSLPPWLPQQIDPYSLPARRRQAWPRWDRAAVARGLAIIAIAAAATWFAWQMFAPSSQPAAAAAEPAWRWPWESDAPNGEPVVELLPADGWFWPWDAAQYVRRTVTILFAALVFVFVLFIFLALQRRRR